jgi:DNA invertase Pin-like site-specific DNA recombinase
MHPNLKTHNVAIYARCATAASASAAIEDQVQRCLAFVERSGGDRSRTIVFADRGIAGRPAQRPGFGSLMAAAEERSINAVVTPELSRVTRDVAEASEICKRLEDAGVTLLTLGDR